jgi:hypothetical protein
VRRPRRRSLVAGACVVLAAAAAGVGSRLVLRDGSGADPTPRAYLAQVSSVCRRYARQLARVPGPSDVAAYGDVVAGLRQALPLMRAQNAAMEAVRPPQGLEPRVERLFVLSHRSVADLSSALAAALRRDAGGVGRGLVRSTLLRARLHTLSVSIGIRCEVD